MPHVNVAHESCMNLALILNLFRLWAQCCITEGETMLVLYYYYYYYCYYYYYYCYYYYYFLRG
jgi:hypothetical protein